MELEYTAVTGTPGVSGDQLRLLDLTALDATWPEKPDGVGRGIRGTLVAAQELRLVAALLRAGGQWDEQPASRPMVIQIVDGEIRVAAGTEIVYARSGELLVIPKAGPLSVEAVQDTSLLLALEPAPRGVEAQPVTMESTALPAGTRTVEWQPVMRELTAGAIMNRRVVTVPPDTPLRTLVEQLVEHRISAVPVVSATGDVLGMVSETDLIDEEKRRVRLPRTLLFGVFPLLEDAVREAYDESLSLTARDVMSRAVFTVPEEASARQVADEMVARQINHVPVTRGGQLVGIIARADILRAVQSEWKRHDTSHTADETFLITTPSAA